MKKFSFLSSVFLLIAVVVFLFVGCQKETTTTEQENKAVPASEGIVQGVAGTSTITGLISPDHAQKMSDAFAKKYPNVGTTTVGYSTKNLIGYLTTLLVKYKMDSVYVGYGLYDAETAPRPSYAGHATIFFTGDRNPKLRVSSSNGPHTDADSAPESESRSLNMGSLFPTPTN
ncbi:MAG: hypothetical protein JO301_17620 [Chitinophagaceae bacterium]|nr:hypothetical protein [Chitinophagaceae bacterium]